MKNKKVFQNLKIRFYNKLIELEPENFIAWYNRGNTLIKLNRINEAIESYNQALKIEPNNINAQKNKYISLKKLELPFLILRKTDKETAFLILQGPENEIASRSFKGTDNEMAFHSLWKTDNEIMNLLINMGVSKKTAKTLTYLSHVDESISRTIEEQTRLRQPEVSTALKELRGRGWIEKHPIRTEGKGRPIHSYRMVVPFDRAIRTLVKEKKSEIEELLNTIKRLKKLTGS